MASSSSLSSPSDPAFSSQSWNHDVFLSFRGEDTRKTFVDHLYSALVRQGIHTYKDDETLPRGESIGPSLLKAIEDSQIAVIVFSVNYADSSWCLDELAHIMKCKDTTGQIVLPIFYDVDPSTVRKRKAKFGEAFAKHKLENKKKLKSWKKDLFDASNLSGWEPKNIANGHESKAIEEIVNKISSRLQLVTASANEKLIGIAARVQRLKSELQIGSGGVRMIGIWGVGGGGKTTLASSIYDEICQKFDGCCFVANIREESSRHGLEKLQEKILKKIKGYIDGGSRIRLRNRKVLIVLDDVDHLDQLKALAGSPDWFGDGSRIIITTRDEHLLKAHEVVVHDISLLQGDEAIKLFHKHAFRGCLPMKDYEQLSEEVVSYAGGLPLALTVLGSSLCDKNIDQWRSALARLKEIPNDKILEKLKVSFDGLTNIQKDLFLDIACFFRREMKDRAMEMLDACGFHPEIGVEELRQKALITISDGRFDMHDLVQEMGHYIVRGEHPKNPEKHSRVWKKEDVLTICSMDAMMDLDQIEAIQVDYNSFRGQEKPPPIVANMRNLRYMKWKGDPANQLLKKISLWELFFRYIKWESDPANPLINDFPPRGLCCLILRGSCQDKLWNGYKCLPNLKIIELRSLNDLIMTPNFDGLVNLENFILKGSRKLEEIDASIGRLQKLVSLHIEDCPGLKMFPSITQLKKLKTLSFAGCPRLFELSEIQQKVDNLRHLHLDNSGVTQVKKPGEDFMSHIRLGFIHRDLRKLDLSSCGLGDEDMSSAVWDLPNLQELDLSCNEFSRLNFGLMRIPRLKLLNVSECRSLVELSELPASIAVLNANRCSSLETFGDLSNCKWLWKVSLNLVYKLDPPDCCMLLDYMLETNTINDHHISVILHLQIPKWFVNFEGRLFSGRESRLHLPHDWYNEFCGFLIYIVTDNRYPVFDITIKQKVDEDDRLKLWQESDEARVRRRTITYVGYVPFSSLRRTRCFDSTYDVLSISLRKSNSSIKNSYRIGSALVPRKSKDDPMQTTKLTTDCSEFQDEKYDCRPTFTIQHDSKSSIEILWEPCIDNDL